MKHFNPTIAEDLQRLFNLKSLDAVSELGETILPVVEVKRFCNICRATAASNSTSATVYTTPSDKDFYLCAASLSTIKDVTGVSNNAKLNVIIEGVTIAILSISNITLTAQHSNMTNAWFNPIKCDRGSIITVTNSSATANVRTDATIQGYTVETTKGS